MLEEERKEGVIDRRVFLGRRVWDAKGVESDSVVRRIRAGMDSRRDEICCCIWSSELDFLGLAIMGTVETSTLPKTGASRGVCGVLSASGVEGAVEPEELGVVGRNKDGLLAIPGGGEFGGLIS